MTPDDRSSTPDRRLPDGQLTSAISNTVVQTLRHTTGRGPTKARTTLGENAVFVVLQDSLTRGERVRTDPGESTAFLALRRRWQSVMETDLRASIEELTG